MDENPVEEQETSPQKRKRTGWLEKDMGCSGCGCLSIINAFIGLSFTILLLNYERIDISLWQKSKLANIVKSLESGIQECIRRAEESKSTKFLDSKILSDRYVVPSGRYRYVFKPISNEKFGGDTCFAARAVPISDPNDLWFEMTFNPTMIESRSRHIALKAKKVAVQKSCGPPFNQGKYGWSYCLRRIRDE